MAQELSTMRCEPCRGGVAPLTLEEAAPYLALIDPAWEVVDGRRLVRRFKLKHFRAALELANRIGEVAEAEGHHPDLAFGWGYLRAELHTHKIGGLHLNDFVLAARIDRVAAPPAAKG